MTSSAVPLDIDGTLVGSSYAHVHARVRALSDAGIAVDASPNPVCTAVDLVAHIDNSMIARLG